MRMPTGVRPSSSKRAMILPITFFSTSSGLMMLRVRSIAMVVLQNHVLEVGGATIRQGANSAHRFFESFADLGRRARDGDTGCFHGLELLFGRAFATGDDRAGVTHALSGRGRGAGDEARHGLAHVGLYPCRGFFFSRATDLANHDDGFGVGVVLEKFERVDEVHAVDRVTTDTDAGALPDTQRGELTDSLVGQRAGAADHADFALEVNMTGHDADLALAQADDAGAVRTEQAHVLIFEITHHRDHVLNGHALGDRHDKLHAGVGRFHDRVSREGGRHVNDRGVALGLGDRFGDRIENRRAVNLLATLAGGHATNDVGAVRDHLLGMKATDRTGDPLHDQPGGFVYHYTHLQPLYVSGRRPALGGD